MKVVAITGGIGTGKSTAAGFLSQMGYPVIDCDNLARLVTQPGEPAYDEIYKEFGPEFFDQTGKLRRDRLAELVFADEKARKKLEAITHPHILKLCLNQLSTIEQKGYEIAFVVVPLLYEVNWQSKFDYVVCIACSKNTQWQRLQQRGLSEYQIQARIDAQWPLNKKMELADFVVWSEGSPELYEPQLRMILNHIENN